MFKFCGIIKELRKEHGLSQAQVAEKLGVCCSTYAARENGKRKLKLAMLLKLAKLYGVSNDYILGMTKDRVE